VGCNELVVLNQGLSHFMSFTKPFQMKQLLWIIVVLLAILVGLLPLTYFFAGENHGFFELKDKATLANQCWQVGFYGHIISGGIAMTIGWMQFHQTVLRQWPAWHRIVGKGYVVASLICAACGVFLGFYATGGFVAATGFVGVGVVYFYTTWRAYQHIQNRQIRAHQAMMIYSYAACLGGVTLRLYMPLLSMYLGGFLPAYRVAAWLSWVPNLLVAHWIVRDLKRRQE
jgi:Predicted membrane protein (DUF2306)